MFNNEIKKIIESDNLLLLKSKGKKLFLYYDRFRMLIPLQQDFKEEHGYATTISTLPYQLNNIPLKQVLIKAYHAPTIFHKLSIIPMVDEWNISIRKWFIDDNYQYDMHMCTSIYDGNSKETGALGRQQKAYILRVVYLPGNKILDNFRINLGGIEKYGLSVAETTISYRMKLDDSDEQKSEKLDGNIQDLLDCDKKRCGLASYEKEMLYDIKAGHWDVFESDDSGMWDDDKLIGRDPRLDIKKNGVIGIDFGTKSTVVVKQEGSNEIRPIRIGSLSLKAEVAESDYENPTIISCMSISKFLKDYDSKNGRPETSCEDLFVSYNAYNDYKNCSTENFYAYYSDLKQWSNSEKDNAVVLDAKAKEKYNLDEESSLEKHTLNPIEVYAYYIGMYINNMRNGIYLKYIMSFPVKYSKATKELIRKSFEKGLKKSLPNSIAEDDEIMSKFSVEYQISEPAAYAVTALEQSGFKPQNENEKYLYGIFDFGGGTTDFDFGVWRGANDEEYDKYNCDYLLECFGADSDVRLGGENILEMLAYQVFKDNKSMAAEKKIACALPADEIAFIGGEHLISDSQSANRNLTLLKEALRPLWEQYTDWENTYNKKSKGKNKENNDKEVKEECIEIQMYDFNGKPVPNCRFDIDTAQLIELIKKRIQKGVDAFFNCIEKSILGNQVAQFASEKIYIFLAGNSCKSIFVKEIFEKTIEKYNKEYGEIGDKAQNRFELIEPLKNQTMDIQYIPNAKTSVAYGLVKSRPGGKIYVKKNYETDSNEETRFKYYLGGDRRGYFDCKLAPMMTDEDGQTKTVYHVWKKFQGAGMGVARIYYTEDPRADSKAEKLDIDNIPFHEVTFEPEEDKHLYVRAINPSVIEYAVASSDEQICDKVETLNIDER